VNYETTYKTSYGDDNTVNSVPPQLRHLKCAYRYFVHIDFSRGQIELEIYRIDSSDNTKMRSLDTFRTPLT